MNLRREPELRQRAWLAMFCLGALCACDDFDPPAAPSLASIDAGRGATHAPALPPARADAGVASVAAHSLARATRDYVLIAVPSEHAVAVVDPRSLQLRLAACGEDEPAWIAAAEDGEVALAVDVEGERACVLQLQGGELRSSSVAIVPHVDRVEFSPDGRFALAFAGPAPGEPARIAQELSAIDLSGPVAVSASVLVGTQPRAVAFSADGEHAVVLGRDGIARLPLARTARGQPELWTPYDFGLESWSRAQVRLAAGGEHALLFVPDSPIVHRLDLVRGERETIDLAEWAAGRAQTAVPAVPAEPFVADALISRDGASVWLALRGAQLLLALPRQQAPFALDLASLGGQPSDRLQWSGDDERALLVFSDEPSDGRAALVSLDLPAEPQRVRLARAPERVLASERGEALALLHDAPGLPAGYSLLRVRDGAAYFRQTERAPIALALSSEAGALAVVVAGAGIGAEDERDAELHVVDFATLERRVHALPGMPLAVGFSGAGRYAFAQLAHPDGRLVLLELASGRLRTTTGFLIPERVQP